MVDPLTQFQEDVVADVLQSIHLQSALYCRAHLSAPWGLGIPRREVATFHIVTAGACWLTVESTDEPVLLNTGDLLILPHGHAHVVADQPTTPVTEFEDFVSQHPATSMAGFTRTDKAHSRRLSVGHISWKSTR